MDRTHIGQVVRQRRLELGLTQHELAELADVSIATVSLIERGSSKPLREATVIGITRALRWPPDAFARIDRGLEPASATSTFAEVVAADPLLDDRARELLLAIYIQLARSGSPGPDSNRQPSR